MNLSRPAKITLSLVAGLFLFLLLTLFFIPSSSILSVLNRQLAADGYELRAATVGKTFPLGLKATKLELRTEKGVVLKAESLTLRLQLFSLLAGKPTISVVGKVGTGGIDAEATLTRPSSVTINAKNVQLEEIPFFATVAGAELKGALNLAGRLRTKGGSSTGELKLDVKGADLRGAKIGDTPLPDAAYQTVQGMLRIAGGKATLESFSMQGEGLFVRLKGDVPVTAPITAAPLNLTLDLMPKPDFLERQKFVFLLLTKYLDTPGHYQIPIHGVMAKPQIQ